MSIENEMIPFAITATLTAVIFVFGMIVLLITFQKKQNRKNQEHLQSLVAEKDRTMSLISMEVHDNVNQILNVARMNVHWLFNSALPEQKDTIEKIGNMLDKLIMDTNNISHTLNTDYLKRKGLIQSLKEETIWVNNSKNRNCSLNISGITERFDGQVEIMLFRIAQEAVNNAIKHAEASYIQILLAYEPSGFSMIITDNGKGFNTDIPDVRMGVGLSSMINRAKIIHGTFNIVSKIHNGTMVKVHVPRHVLKIA
ncbi:MAG TPA: ATP-binding protein [Flavipsychrobacter sp.]|nr:ATP-binding protein [Flavipsychrobacter sp.]